MGDFSDCWRESGVGKRDHEKKKKIDVSAREITGYLETRNIKYLKSTSKGKCFFYLYRWGKEETTCCRVIKINALHLHNFSPFVS